jgi:RimJ/RimL family protein N-acetyltransferase
MEGWSLTGNDPNMSAVVLCELSDNDKDLMFEWINNRELVEFNSFFKPVSWENHCKWFDSIKNRSDVKIFGIRRVSNNKLIGSCQLMNINAISKSAELQIRLGYFSEMGKGLGSQATHQLLKFGFETLGLQRIYLHVFAGNERAVKSYLKTGFKEEGCLRRAAFVGSQFLNVKVMAILKEEFKQ